MKLHQFSQNNIVTTCACSVSQCMHPPTTPQSITNSVAPSLASRASSQQPNGQRSQAASRPGSPIASNSIYNTATETINGRVSKITKKRKSISINGGSLLEFASKQSSLEATTTVTTEPERIMIIGNSPPDSSSSRSNGLNNEQHFSITRRSAEMSGPMQERNSAIVHEDLNLNSPFHMESEPIPWAEGFGWQHPLNVPPAVQEGVLPQPTIEPIPQQQKPCCGGCGPKPQSLPTATPNPVSQNLMLNQHTIPNFHLTSPFTYNPNPQYPNVPVPDSLEQMQPIATTIYTYPNGYTTVNSPLTPREVAMLQAIGAWRSPAATAAWAGMGIASPTGIDVEHSCRCGSGCECLGCASHPFNSSTVNFVRDMRNMMHSNTVSPPMRQKTIHEQSIGVVSEPRKACCGGGGNQPANVNGVGSNHINTPAPASPMESLPRHNQQSFNQTLPMQNQLRHQHHHHSPQSPPTRSSASPSAISHYNPALSPQPRPNHHPVYPANMSPSTYTSGPSPDAANGDDDGDTEQNTVSPSAFFHIDYLMGMCSETDMSCMCGEDCTCFGCLTHGNSMTRFEEQLNVVDGGGRSKEVEAGETSGGGGVRHQERGGRYGGGDSVNGNGVEKREVRFPVAEEAMVAVGSSPRGGHQRSQQRQQEQQPQPQQPNPQYQAQIPHQQPQRQLNMPLDIENTFCWG